MAELHLLRHAKSSWDQVGLSDHDRPLSPRGERAARAMAGVLRHEGVRPDLILCSSAVRARRTLELALGGAQPPPETRVERSLYGAGEEELLAELRRVPGRTRSVLVVAHNPGLQELAIGLVRRGGGRHPVPFAAKFPTGALASFRLGAGGWPALGREPAELLRFVRPRDL